MNRHTEGPGVRFFVVFEPSYALGCLALLSSLTRHASHSVTVDILLRRQHQLAAQEIITKLQLVHGGKLRARIVIVPHAIVQECSVHEFQAHFTPEIMFRLYYFDLVTDHPDFVIYLDLDMLVLADIFTITAEFTTPALLYAVEAPLTDKSLTVMPAYITRYINSGMLAFNATDASALQGRMNKARTTVDAIAARSLYLDQDAVNIAFYDAIGYLPERWNFTLAHFSGLPIPSDVVVLHATGSRKPWFFRGGHPFSAWYDKEADMMGLPFSRRYDFSWPARKLLKKANKLFS